MATLDHRLQARKISEKTFVIDQGESTKYKKEKKITEMYMNQLK